MKRWLAFATASVGVAGYMAFPYYALRALAPALRSGDPAQLERAFDVESVRAALREELDAQLRSAAREVMGEDPFMQGLADVLGGPALDQMSALYVTPGALAALIETGDLSLAALRGASRPERDEEFTLDMTDVSHAFFTDPRGFRVELPKSELRMRLQNGWWQVVAVHSRRGEPPTTPRE